MNDYVLQVNNNGHLSFNDEYSAYDPLLFPLPGTPLIAPFWADVDTRPLDGGIVWFRETTSQADRDRAQREIRAIFMEDGFTPRMVFIATWDRVGYHNMNTDKVMWLLF